MYIKIVYECMATSTDDPEKTTINIRMTESQLADIDAAWKEAGYGSRSEFIRDIARDAAKHPEFNRADLKAMLTSEVEIQKGRTHSSDEVKERLGLDGGDDDE